MGSYGIAWSLLEITTVLISFLLNNWRLTYFILGIIQLLSCILYIFIEKTPYFLLSRNKYKEFVVLLKKTAKKNGKKMDPSFD